MTMQRGWIWAGIGLLILWFVVAIKAVLLPFVTGLAIAYLLDPVADRLERLGLRRWLATIAALGGFFLLFAGLAMAMAPILQEQVSGIARSLPRYIEQLRPLLTRAISEAGGVEQAKDLLSQMSGRIIGFLSERATQIIAGGVAIFNVLTLLLIAPVVAFYLLRDWDTMTARIDDLLPRRFAPVIRMLLAQSDSALSAFVRGQLAVCLIMAMLYSVGWTLLGLHYGLVLGLLAGLLGFIPFVGPFFGAGLATVVALGQFGADPVSVGLVFGVFIVVQAIEGTVLTPNLLGDKVGLHPVWVLFAIFAGGELMGFVGVLLAVPIAAVAAVVGRWLIDRYHEADLFHAPDEPVPPKGRTRKARSTPAP